MVILVILLVGGLYFYESRVDRIFIDDSLVQGSIITIAPSAGGELNKLYVYEGENVNNGDPLAEIGNQLVRADSDGLIVQANQAIGSTISVASPAIQMIDPATLRIAGTIDENKGLSQIKVGQVVSFTVDAFPGNTYWGYVDEVSPTSKQTALTFTISSERPTQQFTIFARYDPQKYPEIKNGMSAKMTVFTHMP